MMDRLRTIFRRPAEAKVVVGGGEIGWGESQLYQGPFPKYNPDTLIGRKGHAIYRKMLLDEQVKAVIRFKRDAITSRDIMFVMPGEKDIKPGSEAAKRVEIYENMVRQTFGSFVDGMNYILMAMHQGFSMTEKIYDTFDYKGKPYVGIRELIPKPFDTFEFHTNEYGTITKIIQKLDGREKLIDLDRFVYYVQNPEYDRHYGQSDLREAYRSWYAKDVIIRFYNQFLERFAGGFVIGKPGSGGALVPGTPDYNAMVAAMNGIQNQTSILLPSNIELEIERPATTDQFEKAIEMHDLQIAKALLIPTLLGITPQAAAGGGFAQANTQLEAFLWTLDADATRLEEAVNEQIFAPLAKINFADGEGPVMRFKAISDTKKMEIVKTWKELVTAGAVEASDSDESHLRELLDFPDKGEPLDLKPEIGEPTGVPPQSRTRGPVEEPNQERTTKHSAAFTRAEKRVSFAVIERKANKIETDTVIRVEARFGDMVADLVARIENEGWGTNRAGAAGIDKIDFSPKQKNKAQKAIFAGLTEAWALGVQHAKSELDLARKENFKINMARIDEEASDFIKMNSFRMLGFLSDDMRAVVQNVLVNGIKFSWTTSEITNKIYDELTKAGFIASATAAAATNRTADQIAEAIDEALGGVHRIRTAIRTNAFEAINEARYAAFTDPELDGFVEALEYSAILDSRTTNICRHLDDRVYPIDAVEWNRYRPPNHHNCRSLLIPVTIVDEDVVGKDHGEGRWSRTPTIEPQSGFGG